MSESVQVIVKGCGLNSTDGNLRGLEVFELSYTFEDAVEFGQFLGPRMVSNRVETNEPNIKIPSEARYTWSIKRVEGADSELYIRWAEEFAESNIGSKDLDKNEVLLYWLQRTQDSSIIDLLR